MRAWMIELSWSGLRVPAIAVEPDCSRPAYCPGEPGCATYRSVRRLADHSSVRYL
ncbi:hypothetical protein [Streptomyces albiflavescens]|uniref:hypothetical protein n=1 Tax=Streptomyces albiflavescens TaxID=1623582 RepID=UPI00166952A1|nr:hypothetical protein [Streptomyces albiflavescens]